MRQHPGVTMCLGMKIDGLLFSSSFSHTRCTSSEPGSQSGRCRGRSSHPVRSSSPTATAKRCNTSEYCGGGGGSGRFAAGRDPSRDASRGDGLAIAIVALVVFGGDPSASVAAIGGGPADAVLVHHADDVHAQFQSGHADARAHPSEPSEGQLLLCLCVCCCLCRLRLCRRRRRVSLQTGVPAAVDLAVGSSDAGAGRVSNSEDRGHRQGARRFLAASLGGHQATQPQQEEGQQGSGGGCVRRGGGSSLL